MSNVGLRRIYRNQCGVLTIIKENVPHAEACDICASHNSRFGIDDVMFHEDISKKKRC